MTNSTTHLWSLLVFFQLHLCFSSQTSWRTTAWWCHCRSRQHLYCTVLAIENILWFMIYSCLWQYKLQPCAKSSLVILVPQQVFHHLCAIWVHFRFDCSNFWNWSFNCILWFIFSLINDLHWVRKFSEETFTCITILIFNFFQLEAFLNLYSCVTLHNFSLDLPLANSFWRSLTKAPDQMQIGAISVWTFKRHNLTVHQYLTDSR